MTDKNSERLDPAPPVLVDRVGSDRCAALVTLNRPDQLNALDRPAVEELTRVLAEISDDSSVRCVLVTGAGRAFCTGGDLKGFAEFQTQAKVFTTFVDNFIAALAILRSMPKPVVALVNGACVAGGLELLLACDFAFAADTARIGDGHLNYAQVGGAGAMTALPRAIGSAKSKELIFSGRLLSADEAWRWGLVNKVVDERSLLAAGVAVANEVAAKSPSGVSVVKQMIDAGLRADPTTAAALERETALRFCTTNPDAAEGIRAFSERRAPVWSFPAHHPAPPSENAVR